MHGRRAEQAFAPQAQDQRGLLAAFNPMALAQHVARAILTPREQTAPPIRPEDVPRRADVKRDAFGDIERVIPHGGVPVAPASMARRESMMRRVREGEAGGAVGDDEIPLVSVDPTEPIEDEEVDLYPRPWDRVRHALSQGDKGEALKVMDALAESIAMGEASTNAAGGMMQQFLAHEVRNMLKDPKIVEKIQAGKLDSTRAVLSDKDLTDLQKQAIISAIRDQPMTEKDYQEWAGQIRGRF